jgi:hypothetical protein
MRCREKHGLPTHSLRCELFRLTDDGSGSHARPRSVGGCRPIDLGKAWGWTHRPRRASIPLSFASRPARAVPRSSGAWQQPCNGSPDPPWRHACAARPVIVAGLSPRQAYRDRRGDGPGGRRRRTNAPSRSKRPRARPHDGGQIINPDVSIVRGSRARDWSSSPIRIFSAASKHPASTRSTDRANHRLGRAK